MTPTQDFRAASSRADAAHAAQQRYEVRFEWGLAGLASIAPTAGVIVIVDALPPLGASAADALAELRAAASAYAVPVLEASLGNRTAVARAILAQQEDMGRRAMAALVAVGETRADGGLRFAVEDHLAAGAVVDALAAVGIDFCSPEAAAAAASFTALQPATMHLLTASTTGQALDPEDVRRAARLDVG